MPNWSHKRKADIQKSYWHPPIRRQEGPEGAPGGPAVMSADGGVHAQGRCCHEGDGLGTASCLDARHARASLRQRINKTDQNDAKGWRRCCAQPSNGPSTWRPLAPIGRALLGARAQRTGRTTRLSNILRGVPKSFDAGLDEVCILRRPGACLCSCRSPSSGPCCRPAGSDGDPTGARGPWMLPVFCRRRRLERSGTGQGRPATFRKANRHDDRLPQGQAGTGPRRPGRT